MLNFLSKNKALKSYVSILPVLLKKKHGKHKQYSASQIQEAIKQAKLNEKYIEYAYAMLMSQSSFEETIKNNYINCRNEIAKKYFGNNNRFTIHDLLRYSKAHIKTHGDNILYYDDVAGYESGDIQQGSCEIGDNCGIDD